jgi:hypothetical protein
MHRWSIAKATTAKVFSLLAVTENIRFSDVVRWLGCGLSRSIDNVYSDKRYR